MLHSRMLGYLDEVARSGSIRRAAERLGIAASSINRQILALEAEYGVALFERLPRRLRLTVAGELLLDHVRQTLREQALLRARLVELTGRRRGLVRVATIGGLVPAVLPPLIAWMQAHTPLVKLSVRAMSLEAVVAAVLTGDAELGLGYNLPAEPRLRVLARVASRVGAVMAPDHPCAGQDDIALRECAAYPLVIPDRSITIGALLDETFVRAGMTVEGAVETNSIEVLRGAAGLGTTIAFMSEIEATVDRGRGLLAFLPLREAPAAVQELRLVARRGGGLDATQSRIAEALREMLARTWPAAP